MYTLRGKLELFRFEILAERVLLARDGLLDADLREKLSTKAWREANAATAQLKKLEVAYMRSRPAADIDDLKAERAWFSQHCRARGDKYVEEYSRLAKHLLTESGYAPLSLQEKADIVKAFGFCKSLVFGE